MQNVLVWVLSKHTDSSSLVCTCHSFVPRCSLCKSKCLCRVHTRGCYPDFLPPNTDTACKIRTLHFISWGGKCGLPCVPGRWNNCEQKICVSLLLLLRPGFVVQHHSKWFGMSRHCTCSHWDQIHSGWTGTDRISLPLLQACSDTGRSHRTVSPQNLKSPTIQLTSAVDKTFSISFTILDNYQHQLKPQWIFYAFWFPTAVLFVAHQRS